MNGYLYSSLWAQDMPGNDWLIGGRYCPRQTMGDVQKKWFKHMGNADPALTPLFLDCQWVDLWPREDLIDGAVNESIYKGGSTYNVDPQSCGSLARSSLTRHGDAVNIVYTDGHGKRVRDADLKYQKWSQTWSISTP
jgi:prepilin-type processing-associated H-X9-DG protein